MVVYSIGNPKVNMLQHTIRRLNRKTVLHISFLEGLQYKSANRKQKNVLQREIILIYYVQ